MDLQQTKTRAFKKKYMYIAIVRIVVTSINTDSSFASCMSALRCDFFRPDLGIKF